VSHESEHHASENRESENHESASRESGLMRGSICELRYRISGLI
jgi:hypothetical protein